MQRTAMRRYHDIASSTKVRGQGIGFAGVGIKLGLLVCEEVVTETRRGKTHVATRWHLAHIIHDRFYCNRRYAAVTGLAAGFTQPSGQARHSVGRHTVSSMPSFLAAPRARLAWRLGGFVTNRHE
jgi:hypothetical protein